MASSSEQVWWLLSIQWLSFSTKAARNVGDESVLSQEVLVVQISTRPRFWKALSVKINRGPYSVHVACDCCKAFRLESFLVFSNRFFDAWKIDWTTCHEVLLPWTKVVAGFQVWLLTSLLIQEMVLLIAQFSWLFWLWTSLDNHSPLSYSLILAFICFCSVKHVHESLVTDLLFLLSLCVHSWPLRHVPWW